jgi:hypothetical protein
MLMDVVSDYFLCDECENKDFVRIYNFSVRFRTVNFSDEMMYDEIVEESYQCTKCKKIFPKRHVDKRLKEMIAERHESAVAARGKG